MRTTPALLIALSLSYVPTEAWAMPGHDGRTVTLQLQRPAARSAKPPRAMSLRAGVASVHEQADRLRAHTPDAALKAQAADAHVAGVLAHSQRNGNYYLVSDLHMGLGRHNQAGAYHPDAQNDVQEDFMRPEMFVKTLKAISSRPGNNTLGIGGDWLDLIEHVPPRAPLSEAKAVVSKIVTGHTQEFRALADAVVNRNLRVVYIRGNHDIHLVDPDLRAHLVDTIVNVAGLDSSEAQIFKQRFAFAGHLMPLGKFGEGLVFHGDEKDLTNNWRNPANPYSYTPDGERDLEPNIGYHVVQGPWKLTETKNPNADNSPAVTSTQAVVQRTLLSPMGIRSAFKLLRLGSKQRVTTSDAQELAEHMDDQRVLQHWAELTHFGKMTGQSASDAAQTLHGIYEQLPVPLHERMTSRFHTVNALRMLVNVRKALKDQTNAESSFLGNVTERIPSVKFVVEGHDHKERVHYGSMEGRPNVGYLDTGTWIKTEGEDRLNIVTIHTDETGRLIDSGDRGPKLRRVNPTTGLPELEPRAFDREQPVPKWSAAQPSSSR